MTKGRAGKADRAPRAGKVSKQDLPEEVVEKLLSGAGRANLVRALARYMYEQDLEQERIGELRKIGS